MIEISGYAYQKLFETLNDNLHISTDYGSPPIFYWYCRMIDETMYIDNYRYLRRGEYKYKLGYSLGTAYVTCEYIGKQRYLIITNYEINSNVLFTWQNEPSDRGFLPREKPQKPQLDYVICDTKDTLFGYRYVKHRKTKLFNLIDMNNRLATQWFSAIRPLQQPYGKYQIIAYINVGGYFCALGYDGKVYNMNKTWEEMYTENKNILNSKLFMNIITEQIDNIMKTNKNVVRLTESDLHRIISESVKTIIREGRNASEGLRQAYEILKNITESGFIPFSSPYPSSSEKRIKDSIISAMRNIETALHFCQDCNY